MMVYRVTTADVVLAITSIDRAIARCEDAEGNTGVNLTLVIDVLKSTRNMLLAGSPAAEPHKEEKAHDPYDYNPF